MPAVAPAPASRGSPAAAAAGAGLRAAQRAGGPAGVTSGPWVHNEGSPRGPPGAPPWAGGPSPTVPAGSARSTQRTDGGEASADGDQWVVHTSRSDSAAKAATNARPPERLRFPAPRLATTASGHARSCRSGYRLLTTLRQETRLSVGRRGGKGERARANGHGRVGTGEWA